MHWFTFNLPAKTYIKKYINTLYGDPIIVDLKTDIGFLILCTLTSRLDSKHSRGCNLDLSLKRYSDKIVFKIPFHYFSIAKKEVSPATFFLLNRFFENKFDHDLHRFVTANKVTKGDIKKNIELFLGRYNIESDIDISYDALKKSEYRYRKSLSKKFSPELSPVHSMVVNAAV
jgi:hypothetical protein